MVSSFTTRRNFEKPDDGDSDWGTAANANYDKLEEELSFSSTKFKNVLHNGNNFSSRERWEQISMTSVVGATGDSFIVGVAFDGRYVYYTGAVGDTMIRYDTTGRFRDENSWEQMFTGSAQGTAASDVYQSAVFDGRYVYHISGGADTMIRYDTTGVFTEPNSWEQISMVSAQGGGTASGNNFVTITFDGRYVHYTARDSDSFVRFDTNSDFTSESSWEQVAMSVAQGAAALNTAYIGCTFDGRYVYHAASASSTLIRYDTTAPFASASSWEQVAVTVAHGGSPTADALNGAIFDGRYVYYVPIDADTFFRFDTTGIFTSSSSWERIAMSSGLGAAGLNTAFNSGTYDGRYVYYVPLNSDTFVRFDATSAFTDITNWQQIAMSSTQGGATLDVAYAKAICDGEYVYFCPNFGNSMIRFRSNVTSNRNPTEYSQVGD